jgi:hypothetical protein
MTAKVLVAVLLSVAFAASGCGSSGDSSGGSGNGGPSSLEKKVASEEGMDATQVHCYETGHYFSGDPLAGCSFDDGTPGGCYSARTGGDLTVPARSEHDASEFPECWQ